MKGLLALSADFIDRLSGGAGEVESEAYETRLASILAADRRLADDLVRIASELTPEDVPLLPRSGWQWFCGFLATRSTRPPDDFLHALFDGTTNIVLRLRTIQTLTTLPQDVDGLHRYRMEHAPSLQTFPQPWLRNRMQRIVQDRARDRVGPRAVEQAYDLLFLLMQVGNEVTMAAASVLLAHEWAGMAELRARVAEFIQPLDEETRAAWNEGLHL